MRRWDGHHAHGAPDRGCHVERLNRAIGTPALARCQGASLPNAFDSRSFSPNYPSLAPFHGRAPMVLRPIGSSATWRRRTRWRAEHRRRADWRKCGPSAFARNVITLTRAGHIFSQITCRNRRHLDRKARRMYPPQMIWNGLDVQYRRGHCCGRRRHFSSIVDRASISGAAVNTARVGDGSNFQAEMLFHAVLSLAAYSPTHSSD